LATLSAPGFRSALDLGPGVFEKAERNIIGGPAARLFKLPPHNDKRKVNLVRFGNLAA